MLFDEGYAKGAIQILVVATRTCWLNYNSNICATIKAIE